VCEAFLSEQGKPPKYLIETGLGALTPANEEAVWSIDMLLCERVEHAQKRAQQMFDVALNADAHLTHVLLAARALAEEVGESATPKNEAKAVTR
jgi:hypothetical protein